MTFFAACCSWNAVRSPDWFDHPCYDKNLTSSGHFLFSVGGIVSYSVIVIDLLL